jgi:hypothetical protein
VAGFAAVLRGAGAIDAAQFELPNRATKFDLRLKKPQTNIGKSSLSRRHDVRDGDFSVNHRKERGKVSTHDHLFFRTHQTRQLDPQAEATLGDIDDRSFANLGKRSRTTESRARRKIEGNRYTMEGASFLMDQRLRDGDAVAVAFHRSEARGPTPDHFDIAMVEPAVGRDREMQRFASDQFTPRRAVVRTTDDKRTRGAFLQVLDVSRKWAWERDAIERPDADRSRSQRRRS